MAKTVVQGVLLVAFIIGLPALVAGCWAPVAR